MALPLFGIWRLLGVSFGRRVRERDARYPTQGSILYRRGGGLIWYEGTIKNASRTGVQFRGEKLLAVGSPIEMSFRLPVQIVGKSEGPVFCRGKIVRTVAPAGTEMQRALAVRILRYRSQPRPLLDIRHIVGEMRGPVPKAQAVGKR